MILFIIAYVIVIDGQISTLFSITLHYTLYNSCEEHNVLIVIIIGWKYLYAYFCSNRVMHTYVYNRLHYYYLLCFAWAVQN